MSAATMPAQAQAERAGRRVEEVLDRLAASEDPAAVSAAEELVRSLMDFYGAGLERVLQLLSAPQSHALRDALLGDELVASLLVLHGLHPESLDARISRALGTVRDRALDVDGFDETTGTLRLRSAAGGGCGCAAQASDVQQAVEDALACFAPEVTAVEMRSDAGAGQPALLQIGTRAGAGG